MRCRFVFPDKPVGGLMATHALPKVGPPPPFSALELRRDETEKLLIVNEATGEHIEFPLATS
jgi:hypothetical protein